LHVVSQARTSLLYRKCARNELYPTLDHPPPANETSHASSAC